MNIFMLSMCYNCCFNGEVAVKAEPNGDLIVPYSGHYTRGITDITDIKPNVSSFLYDIIGSLPWGRFDCNPTVKAANVP